MNAYRMIYELSTETNCPTLPDRTVREICVSAKSSVRRKVRQFAQWMWFVRAEGASGERRHSRSTSNSTGQVEMQGAASLLFAARTVIEMATSRFEGRIALIYAHDAPSRILWRLVRAIAPDTAVISTQGNRFIEIPVDEAWLEPGPAVTAGQTAARRLDAGDGKSPRRVENPAEPLSRALRDFDACLHHPCAGLIGADEAPDVAGVLCGRRAFAPLVHWRDDEISAYAATLAGPDSPFPSPSKVRRTTGPRLAYSHGLAVRAG